MFFLVVALVTSGRAEAQQAIVSLPSADVTPPREVFLMQESQFRPVPGDAYWNTTNFFCYGLGYGTELAVTTFNFGIPPKGERSVAAGFKTVHPLWADTLPEVEIKVTSGAMAVVSVDDADPGHWLYVHASARVPVARTRLTLGVSQGSEHIFGREVVALMAALEQPLGTPKLSLVAEWFSGKHDLANLIYGLAWHPNHHWIVVAAHKVPTPKGPLGAVFELGVFF